MPRPKKLYKIFEDCILLYEQRAKVRMSLNPEGTIDFSYPSLLSRTWSRFYTTSHEHEQLQLLADYILENRAAVQKAFWNMYQLGRDCSPFQSQINLIFKKCGYAKAPNFLRHCTSNWMHYLLKKRKKIPLERLLLPGTHDSGAYQLDFNHVPITYTRFFDRVIYAILQLPIVKSIVKNWSLTQILSIRKQLNDGIRLFDFRLGQDQQHHWYLSHTFLSVPLEHTLKQIKKFISRHPDEHLVINVKIDFPYLNFTSVADIKVALNLFKSVLGDYVCIADSPTLSHRPRLHKNIQLFLTLPEHLKKQLADSDIIGQQDKSEETWAAKTSTADVLLSLKQEDFEKHYKQGKTFSYASFNTTPEFNATIVGKTVTGDSVIKQGLKMQRELPAFLKSLTGRTSQQKPKGLIFDSPTPATVQQIITLNKAAIHNI